MKTITDEMWQGFLDAGRYQKEQMDALFLNLAEIYTDALKEELYLLGPSLLLPSDQAEYIKGRVALKLESRLSDFMNKKKLAFTPLTPYRLMREEKKREILLSMFDGVHSTSELVDQAYQYGVEQGREEAINTVENHIEMLGTGVSINVTLRLREMQGKERKKEMLEDLSTPTTDE